MTSAIATALRRYLITDGRVGSVQRLLAISTAALGGGMSTIQLRAKGWSDRALLEAGTALRQLCTDNGALLIINDRVDIARAVAADGVHLGVEDLPVRVARDILGPDALIGYSPDGDEDRLQAEQDGADYLGIGPVYGTATKTDAGPAIGIEGLRRVVRASPLPVVAIGGIDLARAAQAVDAGAVGVAVVGAVFLADDPRAAAARLRERVG